MRTYYGIVNVTLSVDDEVIQEARRRAEAMGTSVNQLVREYLGQFVGKTDLKADATEFEMFNREELHDRK